MKKFNLYNYWKNNFGEFKSLVFNNVKDNIDTFVNDNRKFDRIKANLSNMDQIDLEMAASTFLIKNDYDLYNNIIETPKRSKNQMASINYNDEYEIVDELLKDMFENNENCIKLLEILNLKIINKEENIIDMEDEGWEY